MKQDYDYDEEKDQRCGICTRTFQTSISNRLNTVSKPNQDGDVSIDCNFGSVMHGDSFWMSAKHLKVEIRDNDGICDRCLANAILHHQALPYSRSELQKMIADAA